jgi:hypothetical protein
MFMARPYFLSDVLIWQKRNCKDLDNHVCVGRDQEEFRGKWFQSNCMPCTNAGPVCQALDCDGGMHHILFVHLHWL